MADWGLYSALRGTDDWQTKRADALMNLQAAEKRQQFAAQQEAEAMKMEEYMNQYTTMMQELDVLKEDQGRVQQAEETARQDIVAGLAKYNGDIRKFMASGGITKLNQYKTNVLNSEEYKNALSNKQNQALWLQDRAKGNRFIKKVAVDVPGVDENGNETTQQQKLSMEEQMALFKEGKISQINYNGSEPLINVNAMDFKKQLKDANDPYNPNNEVSQSEIAELALTRGASEEQAYEIAKRYGDVIKNGGNSWKWGAGDPYKLDLQYDNLNAGIDKFNIGSQDKRAQIEGQYELQQRIAQQKAAAARAQAGKDKYMQHFLTKTRAMRDGQGIGMDHVERKVLMDQYNVRKKDQKEPNYMGTGNAITTDEAMIFGVSGGPNGATLTGDSKTLDLQNAEIMSFGDGRDGIVRHQGKYYAKMIVAVPEDQIDDLDLSMDAGSPWRNAISQDAVESVDGEGPDVYYVTSYMPLDRQMADLGVMNQISKERGIKTGSVQMEAPNMDYDDIYGQMDQMIQSVMQRGNMSYEEAQSFLIQNSDRNWGQTDFSIGQ